MKHVTLVPLNLCYADTIFRLSSDAHVKEALGLKVETIEDTKRFIHFAIEEEKQKKSLSRVILNVSQDVVGITSLKHINHELKRSHIGSWLGYPYWGQGYNEAAKKEIFKIAFENLHLTYVFAGAKTTNVRSQKAQEKLPYISLHVEKQFPEEYAALKAETNSPCVLHVVSRENFLSWIQHRTREKKEG
ncbi:GNAT family N-acetyltransferase [Bacillus sp. DX4.1]|uniref:GNAT family N-acetyltransferase n=1 Tax=Bacillus sp. DX4.1 TaxID=3055867 RepID=UPI0025A042A9|nr:GNAT family N-acetyltransferase [Bacillus sp. DX4.1]MDM5189917.1 GNAT family N-acetyltransferase [Bacillus sp. DX4.1]